MTSCVRCLGWFNALLTATAIALAAPSATSEAVDLLVFGSTRSGPNETSLPDQYRAAVSKLEADSALRQQVAAKAAADAFGGAAVHAPAATSLTYTSRVQEHVEWLSANPESYAAVIQAAYRFVINRDAYVEEITYWREQPATLSYLLLVACIEDWARRNQPGLMVTAGQPTVSINCEFLATAQLAPADAARARELAGLPVAATPDRRVIAASATHLRASGGIHFVTAGAGE